MAIDESQAVELYPGNERFLRRIKKRCLPAEPVFLVPFICLCLSFLKAIKGIFLFLTPLILTTADNYLRLDAQDKFPVTIAMTAPYLLLSLPLLFQVKSKINWYALCSMVLTFELLMFAAESFSISRGHWVWNPARILGPTFFNVPVEEPLLYYWFPPVLVVMLVHWWERFFEKKEQLNETGNH